MVKKATTQRRVVPKHLRLIAEERETLRRNIKDYTDKRLKESGKSLEKGETKEIDLDRIILSKAKKEVGPSIKRELMEIGVKEAEAKEHVRQLEEIMGKIVENEITRRVVKKQGLLSKEVNKYHHLREVVFKELERIQAKIITYTAVKALQTDSEKIKSIEDRIENLESTKKMVRDAFWKGDRSS